MSGHTPAAVMTRPAMTAPADPRGSERAGVLLAVARLVAAGMPAPTEVAVSATAMQVRLDFAASADLDRWAELFDLRVRSVVYEDTWQYTADNHRELWFGRSLHLACIHRIPTGDDLTVGARAQKEDRIDERR